MIPKLALCKPSVWIQLGGQKKMGPSLGIESPGRCVSFPASFSHRSVGSSILASLSEAGGNDPQNRQASPFPLALPIPTNRLLRRTQHLPLLQPLRQ